MLLAIYSSPVGGKRPRIEVELLRYGLKARTCLNFMVSPFLLVEEQTVDGSICP